MYCRKHLISKLPVTQAVIPIGELSWGPKHANLRMTRALFDMSFLRQPNHNVKHCSVDIYLFFSKKCDDRLGRASE